MTSPLLNLLPERTVPLPAGRFLLDLPAGACVRFGRQGFNEAGSFIRTLTVPDPGAVRAMVAAQAEALRVPHEEGGTRLEQVAEGRCPHSWFVYFWKDTAFKDEPLVLNGHFWLDGMLFIFQNTCAAHPAAMAARAGQLEALFGRVRRRGPLEVPPGPGFCMRESYIPGWAARHSDEHIELLVSFPALPGVSLRFRTDTVGEVIAGYPPLLEREARSRRLHGFRLRARERRLGSFPGQELVKRAGPGWACTWECLGRPREPLAPMLLLEMRAGQGWDEGAAMGLWDAILGSLRGRENFLRNLRLPDAIRSSLTL
ncbi:MAG: T6SS immunity protein Tli4 family protein [Holophaga sp.]|nr:T6SS immunity protein Tli4 family protein [Holophaga sp.]